MTYFLLSLIIGLSAAVIVWTIFVLEKDLSPNVLNRLDKIKRKSNVGAGETVSGVDINKEFSEFKFLAFEKLLKGYTITKEIKDMINQADVKWQIDTFLIFSAACAFPCLVFLFTPFKLMAAFAVVTFFLPTIYLRTLINKRFENFSRQFPDALNLMASSLRAGHPLFSAIDIVTDEMPKPISDVFEVAKKEISLGIDSKEAFYSMSKAMPQSIDLRFFVTAVLIQKEVGGNLAELLDSLSDTIRERFKLLGQLRVQTAQTRVSGIILSVVPVMVLLVIFFMNPEYMKPMFETKDGQLALCIAIIFIIAGVVSSKKISDIEI